MRQSLADTDGNRYGNRYGYSGAEVYSNTETSSDTAAAALSGGERLIVYSAAGIDRSRLRVFW
jgi:hypothetical protein